METARLAPLFAALLAGTAFAAPAAEGQGAPLLHAMFQDHAVLQREQPIRVYGRANAGEEVAVVLAGKRARARADADGRWSATLPAMNLPSGPRPTRCELVCT